MRQTPVAHLVLPRPNLARPVPEFVWQAAQTIGRERGLDVEILVPVPSASWRQLTSLARRARGLDVWPEGIDERLLALEPRPTLIPYLPVARRSIESAAFAVATTLLMRRRAARPALIHGSFLDEAGYIAALTARTLDARSLVVAHGTDVVMAKAPRDGGRTRRARLTLRHADSVVTISHALAAELALLGRRAEVVYYTVNAAAFPLSPPTPDGPVLFVGKLGRAKGFEVLLEAMARLPGLRLRAIGLPSNDLDPAHEVGRLGIGDRVELVGETPHAQLGRHYGQACCLVLPSRAEGLGIVLVEALLSGRPVVATDVGGPREVVGDHNGRLIAPGNAPRLAEAIASVVSHRWSGPALRASALPFTWDRMADKLVAATWAALS